tara:strand:+ start:241 stop:456 length:216 start_codon:yes stop_codon:yes gene_type:complete
VGCLTKKGKKMPISKKLIKKMNDYYGCNYIVDSSKDKPEPGETYALTGGPGTPCIAAGNTWKESKVKVKKT